MTKTKVKYSMACPFCGAEAEVKRCNTAPGKPGSYFWACVCDARGFFPEEHFKELDRLKKISFASRD